MSGPFQEIPKKAKFNRCKGDFSTVNPEAMAFHIDVEGADLERRGRRWFAMVGTPQDRPYPEGELPGEDRRGHKIIGAELEGEHPIDLIAVPAEADHGQARKPCILADSAQDLRPPESRKAHLEQQQSDGVAVEAAEGPGPIGGFVNPVAGVSEALERGSEGGGFGAGQEERRGHGGI